MEQVASTAVWVTPSVILSGIRLAGKRRRGKRREKKEE